VQHGQERAAAICQAAGGRGCGRADACLMSMTGRVGACCQGGGGCAGGARHAGGDDLGDRARRAGRGSEASPEARRARRRAMACRPQRSGRSCCCASCATTTSCAWTRSTSAARRAPWGRVCACRVPKLARADGALTALRTSCPSEETNRNWPWHGAHHVCCPAAGLPCARQRPSLCHRRSDLFGFGVNSARRITSSPSLCR